MKTLTTITAAVLIILSFGAFANDETSENRLKIDNTIKTYIDAMAHGKIEGLSKILDSEAKFTSNQTSRIVTHSRSEILSSVKSLKNVEQNCTTDYTILEHDAAQALIKVILKYDGFSKVSLINIANTAEGWKITNVSSSYQ